jgi:hypothetical protein
MQGKFELSGKIFAIPRRSITPVVVVPAIETTVKVDSAARTPYIIAG